MKLMKYNPVLAESLIKEYELDENVEFIRRNMPFSDVEIKESDRDKKTIVSIITTGRPDRYGEIVAPGGADLKEYRKHPIVLYQHRWHELPIGRNMWIKNHDKGLIAKTEYANHEEAQKVYNYRADGFPLGQSIGAVVVSAVRKEDFDELDVEALKIDAKDLKKAKRVITKWILIEYSDVTVPANPDALTLSIQKGIIPTEWVTDEDDLIITLTEKKNDEICPKEYDNMEKFYENTEEFEEIERPAPNFYSCRMNDPDKYDKFRYSKCAQKHDQKCIDVVYGKIKESNKWEVQSLRYNKDTWTHSIAKTHCKSRDGLFEKAYDMEDVISINIDKETIVINEETITNALKDIMNTVSINFKEIAKEETQKLMGRITV